MNKPKCHEITEIIKNLYLGKESDFLESEITLGIDVLVPLNSLDGDIWKKGWRGQILYVPIKDFGTLPDDVINIYVDKIIDLLTQNKKIGIFCLGGHGRTGYLASIILGRIGIVDPIKLIRNKYCKEAIETREQINHIAKLLNNEDLKKYNPTCSVYDYYYEYLNYFRGIEDTSSCEQCYFYVPRKRGRGRCEYSGKKVSAYKKTCKNFINLYVGEDEI